MRLFLKRELNLEFTQTLRESLYKNVRPVYLKNLSYLKTDGGSWLVGLDESPDHNLTIWDWQRQTKLIEAKVPFWGSARLKFVISIGKYRWKLIGLH
jgi:hypothetical protein